MYTSSQESIQHKGSITCALKNLLLQPWLKKKAFTYVNSNKLLEAEIIAQNIIHNNPYMIWSYYILGKVQRKRQEYDLALNNYNRAISLEPYTAYFITERDACIKEVEREREREREREKQKPCKNN